MNPSTISSFRVHRIVEHIKQLGFDFETDELLEMGLQHILQSYYDLFTKLTEDEFLLLLDELYLLAEANEIREAQVKLKEILPEDRGTEIFRQRTDKRYEKATTYPLPYSYPVSEVLRDIKPIDRSSSRKPKKKPHRRGLWRF